MVIENLSRIFYEYGGILHEVDGAMEIHFQNGDTLLLEGSGDGESLRTGWSPWKDPFARPVSDENRDFVTEHGKWTRTDMSHDDRYRDLIGRPLAAVTLLRNEFGKIAGVQLTTSARTVWFVVEGDECHVCWAHPIGFTEVPIP